MPDWIAHLMLAYCITVPLQIKGYQRVLFLIGAISPDLVRFISIAGNYFGWDGFQKFIANPVNHASHSILGVILTSYVLSIFFKEQTRSSTNKNPPALINRVIRWSRKPIFFLMLGGFFHLLLDAFMWPWGSGIPLLYPIDYPPFTFSFGLIWPSTPTAMIVLAPFTIACLGIDLVLYLNKGKIMVRGTKNSSKPLKNNIRDREDY